MVALLVSSVSCSLFMFVHFTADNNYLFFIIIICERWCVWLWADAYHVQYTVHLIIIFFFFFSFLYLSIVLIALSIVALSIAFFSINFNCIFLIKYVLKWFRCIYLKGCVAQAIVGNLCEWEYYTVNKNWRVRPLLKSFFGKYQIK